MAYLINTLERYGVKTIRIVAMPVPGTTGPGSKRLMEWYSRFGFVLVHHTMVKGHLFSVNMELNFPPKLVAGRMDTITPETSIRKGFRPPTAKGGR
jgi:hypothetical protein